MKIKNEYGRFISVPVEDRFWEKVAISDDDSCWEWTGWKAKGYGRIKVEGVKKLAHRVSWELKYGKIPDDMG
jgi:hypothetical protein